MADKFKVTLPNGREYSVEAPDEAAAQKIVQQHDMNARYTEQAETAPAWAKPFMAAQDVGRIGLDIIPGFTKGMDYLQGTGDSAESEQVRTKAARNRMGWAGTALDAGLMARFLPTAVPRVVGALGGGTAARAITGTATGAAEGAAYGGATAASRDEDVGKGVGLGVLGGVAGQTVGGLVNAGTKKFNEVFRGAQYGAPQYNLQRLPKNPTAKDLVNVAVTKAEKDIVKGANPQDAFARRFEDLPTKPFGRVAKEGIKKVTEGELATSGARKLGEILSDRMLAAGAGMGSGGLLSAVGTMATMLSGGKALKAVANQGTRQAAQDVRRMVYGRDKFVGPISAQERARVSHTLRQLGIDLTAED